ncbi:MAG: cohesin domain-containing protein, partial [bacterium]|nr:cohesin domain-containing protein [bacterium]MDW8163228.1 cohesin domain-containing protein [Candidatus Omnitrophota bacterium]
MKRLFFSIIGSIFLFCVSVFGVTVSIPNVNVNPGATTVQIPLQFNDATGVDTIVGFQTTITFDNSILQATGISNGSLTSNWTITPNINNPSGSIQIIGIDLNFKGFRGGSGSLCVINFNIIGGTPGLTYPLTITSSKLSNPYGTLI